MLEVLELCETVECAACVGESACLCFVLRMILYKSSTWYSRGESWSDSDLRGGAELERVVR